jgi:hypothetical protein
LAGRPRRLCRKEFELLFEGLSTRFSNNDL